MTVDLGLLSPLEARLEYQAVSSTAHEICRSLGAGIAIHEQNTGGRVNRRREAGQDKLTKAMGAFLADLLVAAGDPESGGWVYRAMRTAGFSGERVGIKIFRRVLSAMVTRGFVEAHEDNEIKGKTKARASHWRATERLLRVVEAKGITPANVEDHFQQGLPECPVGLRAASEQVGRYKVKGEKIVFIDTPQTMALEAKVGRLNEFLDGFEIKGGNHRGYTRIFNNGSKNGYEWNQGGRLYSRCQGKLPNGALWSRRETF